MYKAILISASLALIGCARITTQQEEFPLIEPPPAQLMLKPAALKIITFDEDTNKVTDGNALQVITSNYMTCKANAGRLILLQEWAREISRLNKIQN